MDAFVLIEVDSANDPVDGFLGKACANHLWHRLLQVDVAFEDGIEKGVGRQRVLVRLIGFEFGTWRLRDRVDGYDLGCAVDVFCELIDPGFGNIADHGKATAHVAVQGAVADGHFTFVAGGENKVSELVGQRHEGESAEARLKVLFGLVWGESVEVREELVGDSFECGLDGDVEEVDAETVCEDLRVIDTSVAGVAGGHGDADDVVFAEGGRGEARNHRAVDAAAQAEDGGAETAFSEIVPDPEHERIVERLDAIFRGGGAWCGIVQRGIRLLEGGKHGCGRAICADEARLTVEDELVVGADRVAVSQRCFQGSCDGGEHFDPAQWFIALEG